MCCTPNSTANTELREPLLPRPPSCQPPLVILPIRPSPSPCPVPGPSTSPPTNLLLPDFSFCLCDHALPLYSLSKFLPRERSSHHLVPCVQLLSIYLLPPPSQALPMRFEHQIKGFDLISRAHIQKELKYVTCHVHILQQSSSVDPRVGTNPLFMLVRELVLCIQMVLLEL